MRAAVLRNGRIVVDEIPDPAPQSGEVLVQSLACGICGADLHTLDHGDHMVEVSRRTGGPMAMDLDRDVVLGHEFCAEVVDYGPDTSGRLERGARVCAMPLAFRGTRLEPIGYSNEVPGGFGEYMVLPENLLLEVPAEVPPEVAALTEPMAVAVHGVAAANLQKREVPVVLGCGPIGLAVIAVLRRRGVGPIVAADFIGSRRALAEQLGADIVVDPAEKSPFSSWYEVAAPPGFNPADPLVMLGLGPQLPDCVVFECVGRPGIIESVLESAPRNVRTVVLGVCMQPDSIEPIVGITKEAAIQFVAAYRPEEFAETLGAIAGGELDAAPMITDKVGLGGVAGAFERLGRPEGHAKIIVEPWRD